MRIVTVFCLIAVLAAPGCSMLRFAHKSAGDPTIIPPDELRRNLAENRDRLAGVDSDRHMRHTYLGVDVTGESPWMATGRILWSVPMRLYHFINGDTPIRAAVAMEDSRNPDHRREGMMKLVGYRFGRKEPYVKRYAQIATEPVDYSVRAAAIRALNYSRSRLDTDAFLLGLDDAEPAVRLEAAKALANLPVEKSVGKLIEHLNNDTNKDVRIACADALRNFKTLDVTRALMAVLGDRDFGVSWQARQSLNLMTGRDFHYDESAWLEYLAKAQKPFI